MRTLTCVTHARCIIITITIVIVIIVVVFIITIACHFHLYVTSARCTLQPLELRV